MRFRSPLDVVQEVMSVWKELRESMTCLLCGLDMGERGRCAARGRNTEDGGARGARRKDDRAVPVPRAAAARQSVRQNLYRPTVKVESLELPIREEPNGLAVGRPEG